MYFLNNVHVLGFSDGFRSNVRARSQWQVLIARLPWLRTVAGKQGRHARCTNLLLSGVEAQSRLCVND